MVVYWFYDCFLSSILVISVYYVYHVDHHHRRHHHHHHHHHPHHHHHHHHHHPSLPVRPPEVRCFIYVFRGLASYLQPSGGGPGRLESSSSWPQNLHEVWSFTMNDLVYLAWPMMDPTPMVPCFGVGWGWWLTPESWIYEGYWGGKTIYARNCFFFVLLLWGVFVMHHCGEIYFHSLSISLVRFFLLNDGHVC